MAYVLPNAVLFHILYEIICQQSAYIQIGRKKYEKVMFTSKSVAIFYVYVELKQKNVT